MDECRAAQGAPHGEDTVKHVDLNGDARDDHVPFAGWLDCDNAPAVFGDREKPVMVFVGDKPAHHGMLLTDGYTIPVRRIAEPRRCFE